MHAPRDRVRPSGPWYTAYMLAITASSTCAVQMFDVAFSRRMCCSRVCSASRYAGSPLRVDGDADEAAGQRALELVARREEAGVRAAVAHRHAEALRRADHRVGAPFARRREQRQREQVGGDDDERAARAWTAPASAR